MTFQSLADFSQAVHDAMVTNAVTFPSPPVDMVTFQADITALDAAITAWGTVGARGSHADYLALLSARQAILNDLDALGGYVQGVARANFPGSYVDQQNVVLLAAMRSKSDSNRLALWGVVNDFTVLVKQNLLGTGIIHLRWKKPDVPPGALSKPASYNVYVSDDNLTFAFDSNVTSTSFSPTVGSGVHKYFKVAPVSAAGEGGMSSSIGGYGQ